jgi:transcriptional regulator with XRE-family HTH domain
MVSGYRAHPELKKWQSIIGMNLKNYRKDLEMSQYELASRCGISQEAYRRTELGENCPTINTLLTLAQFFGVEWTDFLVHPAGQQPILEEE